MFVTLTFDVEDYITPESHDTLKWLAEILTDENASGTFLIAGEKARALKREGRSDVIDAVRRHDIGFHSNYHSFHPTISEYLENLDWQSGCREIRNREIPGLRDVEKIFGKRTSCVAAPGASYGAQLVSVSGQLGKAYMYSPIYFPDKPASWFCGTLAFSGRSVFLADRDIGFDKLLAEDDKFQAGLDRLKLHLEEQHEKGMDWVGIFCCHPTRVGSLEWWDNIFLHGINPPRSEWKKPPLRTQEEMDTAKKNYKFLVKFLVSNKLIELKTVRELIPLYSARKSVMGFEKIEEISMKALGHEQIHLDSEYSSFEIILAMVDFLLGIRKSKRFKKSVALRKGLGLMEEPPELQNEFATDLSAVFQACKYVDSYVKRTGCLPSRILIDHKEAGIGSLYHLLAEAVTTISRRGNTSVQPLGGTTFKVKKADSYPCIPEAVYKEMSARIKSWTVHRDDLRPEKIIRHFRLQSWTLKPAELRFKR